MLLVDDRLKAARDHALAGRHDNAALLYESILDMSPGHSEALSGLIETRLANGDLEGAQSLLSKATAATGQDPGFLTLAAKIALLSQKHEEAEKLVDRALALDPFHPQAALIKAEFLAAANALPEAEELLNTVRSRNTGDTDILQGIAKLYFAYGLFSPALMVAQEAHALSPDNAALNAFVGQILTVLGDHGKATPFLEKAHLKEPTHPEYLLSLANNAAAIGQVSEALRLANRAKTLFPELMPAWLCYIKIKAERDEAVEALREFAPVAKGAKDRMDATLTLGTAYRLAGEPEKTLQLLEPLLANAARMDEPVRMRLHGILRDAFLSTGQLDKVSATVEISPDAGGVLQPGIAADPDAVKRQLENAAVVIDPGLTNLEFMVLARFVGAIGRGPETPIAGSASLSQLARMFGYRNYLANDVPNAADQSQDISTTLPASQILALPDAVRGGPAGALPYLPVREDYLAKWRAALSEFPRPWIGLSWNEAAPGLTLDTLLPALGQLPGTLVSTVWDHSRKQLEGHPGIIDAGRHFQNLDDLAALIQLLDFVIGPDGLATHAAGAAGRPGLVIVSHTGPWYWYAEDKRCLWYPSLDVVKAPRFGHWAAILPDVTAEIQERLDERLGAAAQTFEDAT